VVKRYQQMLFSLSLKMLGDEEEAKDVVQETFIRVWQNLRNYIHKRDGSFCVRNRWKSFFLSFSERNFNYSE